MLMAVYSFALAVVLGVTAPVWLWRMARLGRYREGLGERLGRVPEAVRAAVAGKKTVWVHAVSVGEVLAAERLIGELRGALGEGWVVAVSTTTATGQKIARERLAGGPVFYFPLDFGFAVGAWMRVLRPRLVVLVESEFWPRHLVECERAGVPVAVVNARVSDRSFPRYMRLRRLWKPLLGKVSLFLAQGEESAERLRRIGAPGERVGVSGNLKYDSTEVRDRGIAGQIRRIAGDRPIVVGGSTAERRTGDGLSEEEMLIQAWEGELRTEFKAVLVLAPRHPERFGEGVAVGGEFRLLKASEAAAWSEKDEAVEIVLLDTIGDLAAVYGVADVGYVGGSLVGKGGQNPLEAARFAVPVVMGESYENFREIVDGMRAAEAIRIVDAAGLSAALGELLRDDQGMGARGKAFFEGQAGATGRTVGALMELLGRGR